jgi:hypothetical protein
MKKFERKYHKKIGMNLKMCARVLRFSKAYSMHESFPNLFADSTIILFLPNHELLKSSWFFYALCFQAVIRRPL